jgi:hypothetical protein
MRRGPVVVRRVIVATVPPLVVLRLEFRTYGFVGNRRIRILSSIPCSQRLDGMPVTESFVVAAAEPMETLG